jgi:multidrug resistance protein, MATE family
MSERSFAALRMTATNRMTAIIAWRRSIPCEITRMPRPVEITRTEPERSELRATFRLALPMVIAQVGIMAMGTVDTLMVGHVSGKVLAAVALGNIYFFNVSIFGMGTLMALDPLVSQAVGAGDEQSIARAVQRGAILGLGIAIATALLLLPSAAVFRALHQPPDIIGDAAAYLIISAAGVLPFFAFVVFRQTLQALGRVAPIVWTILLANVLNASLNWVFVYGHLGAPPMLARGSAIATAIARWAMAIMLFFLGRRQLAPRLYPLRDDATDRVALWSMLKLGAPIGGQQMLEAVAFGGIGLLMGVLGTRELAAHQVAITLAALTFMVPLGVGAAASVRVGQAIGSGDARGARAATHAAYICGVGFMCVTALAFLFAPHLLAAMMTNDPAVVAIAATLIPVAGVFQVFDGAQAVGAGVLRGIGDTRAPLIAMLGGYWLLGLPISVWLGFRTSLREVGLWYGFVVSLGVVAIFLLLRIRVLFGRTLQRIELIGWHRDERPLSPDLVD